MFFNNIKRRLEEVPAEQNAPEGMCHDYIFADDLTTMIIACEKEVVRTLSHTNVANVREALSEDYLSLQEAKTHNRRGL